MTNEDKNKLKRLRDMGEYVIDGKLWTKLNNDQEFKVSPHGLKGDYDKDCYWVDFEELDEVSSSLNN